MAFAEWPVAAALLDAGARPTTRDGMGMGPFHLAALYGNVDCARGWLQRFVEWDVDAKVWPLFGNTPLHLAAGYASGMQPLAQILIFFLFLGGRRSTKSGSAHSVFACKQLTACHEKKLAFMCHVQILI